MRLPTYSAALARGGEPSQIGMAAMSLSGVTCSFGYRTSEKKDVGRCTREVDRIDIPGFHLSGAGPARQVHSPAPRFAATARRVIMEKMGAPAWCFSMGQCRTMPRLSSTKWSPKLATPPANRDHDLPEAYHRAMQEMQS